MRKAAFSEIFQIGKTIGLILSIFCLSSMNLLAQDSLQIRKESNRFLSEAEDALAENDFPKAEAAYRKAIAKDPTNAAAKYNLGNSYYINQKFPEAEMRFKQAAEEAQTKAGRHKAFHNLGNVLMEKKDYPEAVRAYENALRNDPTDEETRYNLAYAKKKMQEEQQQQNQDGEDEKKDEQNQDGEGGEDQQKDQGEQNQQGDDGKQDQDQNKKEGEDQQNDQGQPKDNRQNNQKQQQDQNQQPNQPQPAQGKLSPEQVKSLLEAMENAEKKVQDKVNARKAQGQPRSTDKDW